MINKYQILNKFFAKFAQTFKGYDDLDRRYTWIKCNKDFKGYYMTDYFDNNFDAIEYVLL